MVRNLPAICGFGRYELLGRLAVGGMAEIYLAREPESVAGAGHRYLVIKRILSHVADDPTFTRMFFDEARLAMRLNHPSIVHIYEFGQEQGSYFLAMEWVDGVALGKLIRRAREQGGIPAPVAVKIVAQVADALHYAHHFRDDDGQPLNIVHRDVSPQNIMVSYEGAVKLLDFGIAKATIQHNKTGEGQVKGKFAYMSPQQCLGEPVDGRADVFALGVVLYEALTGLPLYHRKTQYETMRAVIEDPVPSIRTHRPDLPEELDHVVRRALAKEPDDRFPTAGDLQVALERWLAMEQEVVPARRLTEFLRTVFGEDIRRAPMVDSTPFGQSFQRVEGARLTPPPAAVMDGGEDAANVAMNAAVTLDASSSGEGRPDAEGEPAPEPLVDWEPEPTGSSGGRKFAVGVLVAVLGTALLGAGWYVLRTGSSSSGAPAVVPRSTGAAEPDRLGFGTSSSAPIETAMAGQPVPTMEAWVPPQRGTMLFRSQPPGATVALDDRDVQGRTPTALYGVEPGVHEVTIRHDGYRTWRGRVEVSADEEATIEARLRPRGESRAAAGAMRASSRLSINTRPWSKVYLRGRLLGTTPIGRVEVPAGSLQLRLVDRDGQEHRRSVTVEEGGEERLFFDLSAAQ